MLNDIKICGISTREAVDAALESGATMVGFVFFEPSPRNVSVGHAAALAARTCGRLGVVALTVDAPDNLLGRIAEDLRPDLVQLHGRETPDRADEIRRRFNLRVMKAIGVGDAADLLRAREFEGAVDRILLDARPPKHATRPGGNGAAFDWDVLSGFTPGVPWILSGGLNAENIGEAIGRTQAPGVDVSSGVERAPGRKDQALIRAFVARAREAAVAKHGAKAA